MSKEYRSDKNKLSSLRRDCLVVTILYTVLVLWSLVKDISSEKSKNLDIAQQKVLNTFNKDIALRSWSAKSGGVYIPLNKSAPHSRYLNNLSERNILLPSGKKLTLINPARMIREVMEEFSNLYGVKGVTTSLKVINPENKPDKWHRNALLKFEKGTMEISELVTENDITYMRLFRPLATKESCLKCHAHQGYKVGDVRGGISISIPLDIENENKAIKNIIMSHGLFLMVMFFLTLVFYHRGKNLIKDKIDVNAAIHEKEELILLLLNSTAEGIYGVDVEGYCTFCNQSAIRMLGFTKKEDLLGKHMHPLIHHTRLDGSHYPVEECRIYRIFEKGEGAHVDDEVLWKADGSSFNAEYWSYPVFKGGKTVGAVVTFVDITERIKTHEALAASEKRYRDLAENSTDWIWELDHNDCFTYTSPGIKDIMGYTPEEVVGKSAFDLVSPEDSKSFTREFSLTKKKRSPFSNLEKIFAHKSGDQVTLELSGIPIIDSNGDLSGYRGISRDISERKMFESKLRHAQKMEAIGTLSGGIAHDFNNILAAILGYTELAMEDISPDCLSMRHIENVKKAAQRAKDLVRHILSFSRKGTNKRSPVQIGYLIKEVIRLLRATIPTTIKITHDIDKNCGNILADSTQVHQVIMNLCTNAAQSMDEMGGVLKVELLSESLNGENLSDDSNVKPGNYVRLNVLDSGQGIDQTIIDKIFDPYFTTKEFGKGSGMGLAVVSGIVKNHDGMIKAESESGKGATFSVHFPVIDKHVKKEIEDDTPIPTGKERILVVDDDEDMADLTRNRVARLGYHAVSKKSSTEALELFRSDPDGFDLVLTDQTMPEITGENLAKEMFKIRPNIPIIICTGYSSKMDEEKANSIGIKAYIMKPVDKKDLARTLRMVLD